MDALNKLQITVTKAYRVNSNIKFEVFIHKVSQWKAYFSMAKGITELLLLNLVQ